MRTASYNVTVVNRNVLSAVQIFLVVSVVLGAISCSVTLAKGHDIQSRSIVFAISRTTSSKSETVYRLSVLEAARCESSKMDRTFAVSLVIEAIVLVRGEEDIEWRVWTKGEEGYVYVRLCNIQRTRPYRYMDLISGRKGDRC